MMLFAASCSSEKIDEPTGDGNVTFAVQLPTGLQSRTVGDGTTATKLYVAAYEAGTNAPLSVAPGTTPVDMSNRTANVNLQLVTGKAYDIVFWAQAEGAPYSFNPGTRTVDMNYGTAPANAENRDAFFKVVSNYVVAGPATEAVTLKRPFAQLNFATSDWDAAQAGGLEVATTSVVVKQLRPTLSLVGEGTATGTAADVTFTDALLPTEGITIGGTAYKYLSFNYLLMDDSRSVVDVKLTAKESATDLRELEVASVPVQRNYRTNIYGALLTSTVNYNVTIDPAFTDPAINSEYVQITTASQLTNILNNLQSGETKSIVISNDITISASSPITIPANTNVIIDTNGRVVTSGSATTPMPGLREAATSGYLFNVAEGSTLTFIGKGEINAKEKLINVDGKLVIEDGTFNAPDNHSTNRTIMVNPGGVVEVNGGKITSGYNAIRNHGGTVTINNASVSSTSSSKYGFGQTYTIKSVDWIVDGNVVPGRLVINNGKFTGIQGVIAVTSDDDPSTHDVQSSCEINGGTFSAVADVDGSEARTFYALYVANKAQCTVNGGTFNGLRSFTVDGASCPKVAVVSSNEDVAANPAGVIVINGGKFSQKAITLLSGVTSFIEPANEALWLQDPTDKYYYVVPNAPTTNNRFLALLAAAGYDATLSGDTYAYARYFSASTSRTAMNHNGGTIDGNNFTYNVVNANSTWDCGIHTTGGTIKNITIKGAFRGIFTWGLKEDLYVENVTVYPGAYPFNADSSNGKNVTFKNCSLNGWLSYTSGFGSVSFIGCSFAKCNYAYVRPYSPSTFTDCTFSTDMELDATQTTGIVLKNCKVGDTIITADNVTTLLGADAAGVTIQND